MIILGVLPVGKNLRADCSRGLAILSIQNALPRTAKNHAQVREYPRAFLSGFPLSRGIKGFDEPRPQHVLNPSNSVNLYSRRIGRRHNLDYLVELRVAEFLSQEIQVCSSVGLLFYGVRSTIWTHQSQSKFSNHL